MRPDPGLGSPVPPTQLGSPELEGLYWGYIGIMENKMENKTETTI